MVFPSWDRCRSITRLSLVFWYLNWLRSTYLRAITISSILMYFFDQDSKYAKEVAGFLANEKREVSRSESGRNLVNSDAFVEVFNFQCQCIKSG